MRSQFSAGTTKESTTRPSPRAVNSQLGGKGVAWDFNPEEKQIAIDLLERYSGSKAEEFQPYLLLTNFPRYVEYFAQSRGTKVQEGAMFSVAHSPSEKISILDFKIGSPAAAMTVDVCSFLPFRASLMLGMCGGLRRSYQVGDYFVPVASIRGEGTSDLYFPPEVPAMANFFIQKAVTNVLETEGRSYHIGITHTTNHRLWEFNEPFKEHLAQTRAQAIDMECATLFSGSYARRFPLGALLLISDKPLDKGGVKTKEKAEYIYKNFTEDQVQMGVKMIECIKEMEKNHPKGAFRRLLNKPKSENH